MKRVILPFIGCLIFSCANAQNTNLPTPEWNMTVRVVDELNQPVTNAEVRIWYHLPATETETIVMTNKSGFSDRDGFFSASARSTTIELIYEASKNGYYPSSKSYELGLPFDYDPEKWRPTVTLLLKKINQPIAMYAKRIEKGPPVFNEPVGYDLVIGDWIAPHGKGQTADIIFTGDLKRKALEDYDYKLTVSFPKPGDGLREFSVLPLELGAGLRSSHEAPFEGYQPRVVRTMSRHPGQGTQDDSDKNRSFFFRVRTVLDERGNVKSALYGKIYGDFMRFRYYLNPTPNDRNIEFDPKQNLLKGINSLEQVTAP